MKLTTRTPQYPFVLFFLLAVASISSIAAALEEEEEEQGVSRIVGGGNVEKGEYPYFVQMGGCGGALVAPDVVLFAAHCGNWKNKQLNIGAWKSWETRGGAEGRFCDQWVDDPKYDDRESPPNYDFALCKLDRPIYIDESKVKLELNFQSGSPNNGDELMVMGFGRLKEGNDAKTPDTLHDVKVNYITNSQCNDDYNGKITDQMLCAGVPRGGSDACQGDSGGPIVRRRVVNGKKIDTHVGVVSWGYGCARPESPGVYARTSSRASAWIKPTICNTFKSVASYCSNPEPKCKKAAVTIKVKTDDIPNTIWWKLRTTGNLVVERKFAIEHYQAVSELCLDENKCYDFEVRDSGEYSVNVQGKIRASRNDSYGGTWTHRICTKSAPIQCEDNKDFFYQGDPNLDCEGFLTGTKKAVNRKCRNRYYRKRSVRNYWCRKTCAEKLDRADMDCFPYDDTKKTSPTQDRQRPADRENRTGIGFSERADDRGEDDNIFKKTPKSQKSRRMRRR